MLTTVALRLNFETVKCFNSEDHEVRRYTKFLREFEGAQQRVITSLSALNFGQNVIFSTAMTGALPALLRSCVC